MRNERINLLVSADEKAAIEAAVAALRISTSEMVRRAVKAYNPEFDSDAVQTLADELATVVKGTEKKVNAALTQLRAFEAFFADPKARRAEAQAALEREELEWPFPVPVAPKSRRKTSKTTGTARV